MHCNLTVAEKLLQTHLDDEATKQSPKLCAELKEFVEEYLAVAEKLLRTELDDEAKKQSPKKCAELKEFVEQHTPRKNTKIERNANRIRALDKLQASKERRRREGDCRLLPLTFDERSDKASTGADNSNNKKLNGVVKAEERTVTRDKKLSLRQKQQREFALWEAPAGFFDDFEAKNTKETYADMVVPDCYFDAFE
jgi:hypothetical protein